MGPTKVDAMRERTTTVSSCLCKARHLPLALLALIRVLRKVRYAVPLQGHFTVRCAHLHVRAETGQGRRGLVFAG